MFRFEMPKMKSEQPEKLTHFPAIPKNEVTVYFEDAVLPEQLSETADRARRYMDDIESIVGNNENQIDYGGAATVFADGDFVLKVMNNRHLSSEAHLYNLGSSPREEF